MSDLAMSVISAIVIVAVVLACSCVLNFAFPRGNDEQRCTFVVGALNAVVISIPFWSALAWWCILR